MRPMDHRPDDPIPFDQSPEGDEAPPRKTQARFPVFLLAFPGVVGILFTAMHDALANSMGSASKAFITAIISTLVAVASFAAIAANVEEKEVKVPAIVAIGIALLVFGGVVLRSI